MRFTFTLNEREHTVAVESKDLRELVYEVERRIREIASRSNVALNPEKDEYLLSLICEAICGNVESEVVSRAKRGHLEIKEVPRVRINTVIVGEPAKWLREWKRRGLVTSYTDAIIQALRAMHEKIVEQYLKLIQLRNMREVEEEW